jgi:hypothetical protein
VRTSHGTGTVIEVDGEKYLVALDGQAAHTPTLNGSQNAVMVNSSWLLPFSTDKKTSQHLSDIPSPLTGVGIFKNAHSSFPFSIPEAASDQIS